MGNRRSEGVNLGNIGVANFYLGNERKAIDYYEQALSISRKVENRDAIANQLEGLGVAYLKTGQVEKARKCLEESLAIFEIMKSHHADQIRGMLSKIGL